METKPIETLYTFIAELLLRQRSIDESAEITASLVYAEASLLNQMIRPQLNDFPAQIVVVGPTQAGKSTITNLLTGTETAVASALAGYTRHPQGFSTNEVSAQLYAEIGSLLAGLTPTPREQLSDQELNAFSLSELPENSNPLYAPAVIWDTPDFDSVSSRSYRYAVPKVCAIANVIVMVVSKEKYADQTVWETLRLISQLPHPLYVVINKVSPGSEAALEAAIAEKFAAEQIATAGITSVPYLQNTSLDALLAQKGVAALREAIAGTLDQNAAFAVPIKPYLQTHWQSWTTGIEREQEALKAWQSLVDQAATDARAEYERDYLRNPNFDETMQRAIVRLLGLLELPGVGGSLAQVRNVITWPARTLYRKLVKQQSRKGKPAVREDLESETLHAAINGRLTHLQRISGDHAAKEKNDPQQWWNPLWLQLQEDHESLEKKLDDAIKAHQSAFEPRIQEAADQLFAHLQEHPATLNGLRAARVTADAAGVVLALKTGGIGINDLVLTPAMLSFTSMLAEGAVGRYMAKVEAELKKDQLASVDTHVLRVFRDQLNALPDHMDQSKCYGLSAQQMREATAALEALPA
ncbi:MAG: GTPase [Thiotrichales bacterium]